MNDYNLIYVCNRTGKKYEVKRVTNYTYRIRPYGSLPFSGEEISPRTLCKNFSRDKEEKRGNFQRNNWLFNKRLA